MTSQKFNSAAMEAASDDLARHLRSIMVAVRSRAGGGSGTIWGRDGLVITNNHVVYGEKAEVVTADGRTYAAEVVAREPEVDLASLRVSAEFDAAAEPRDTTSLRVGELAFAMGNPWGQPGVLTRGIIVSRGAATIENQVPLEDAIRADVRLAPGNSGGPLADASGRVIGINSMIAGAMAIAVPADTVARFLAGKASAFLGITGQPVPLPVAIAASYGGEDGFGLMVTEVSDGSPASSAGLIPGDVFLSLDGEPGGLPAIGRRLRRMKPDRPLRIQLLRGNVVRELEARPIARA